MEGGRKYEQTPKSSRGSKSQKSRRGRRSNEVMETQAMGGDDAEQESVDAMESDSNFYDFFASAPLQMEGGRKAPSKQTPESSRRSRNDIVWAMSKDNAEEAAFGSSLPDIEPDSFSDLLFSLPQIEQHDPLYSFVPDPEFFGLSPALWSSHKPPFPTLSPVPSSRSALPISRWIRAKDAIVATLRFRSRIRRSKSINNLADWKLISIIAAAVGESSSGVIYEAVNKLTGQTYALLQLPYDASRREEISREIDMLKELDHPNLVKCHDAVISADDTRINLILEPLEGSLAGVSVASESELVSLARPLLLGLAYLHQNKIAHGGIKHSSIFFSHTRKIKLLYLGKTLSNTPPFLTEIGAVHDEFSWDVWSAGLCILKWSEGLNWSYSDSESVSDFPEKQKSSLELDQNFVSPPDWNVELLKLVISCMQTDLLKRWTAEKLVHHPFFDQFKMEVQFPFNKLVQFPRLRNEFRPSPLKIEAQLPSLKKAFQPSLLKTEAQLPSLKKEFQTSPLKKEKNIFHEREEMFNPVKKKSKLSMEDEDGVYDVENPKDPTRGIPHVVPERCIEHCNLFLPDYEFEKDKLVRMWIAEECIELGVTRRMEDVGNLCFDALVQEEIIAPSKFDNVHRQMKYRFNASKVSDGILKQGNYLRINARNMDEIHSEALHLTWECKRLDRTFSDALKNLKQLHTLVVHEEFSASISQLPNDIFLGLRLLRTLDLSRTHISEVPGSIGKLESLQYLDISETPIKRLPESLDRLYCLQTLNLKDCVGITTLPRGFGRLVNLRHLDLAIISQLKSMPRGMGVLIKLQTLRAFIVGKNDGCRIVELKNMNEITGSFCISRLENVANAEEAKEAALSDKKYIDKLELRWHNGGSDNFQETVEILENLQPHFDLKELQLTYYDGSQLPRWISDPAYIDLSSITLYKCINCDILPSIGKLPSLKILHIVDMENIRNIDSVFCRDHESEVNAFPRLEKLILDSMPALEVWTGVENGDFLCLGNISIKYCPKLRILPSLSHLRSLEHFEVSNCMQLISLPELPRSLDSLIIRGCPGISERCRKDGGVDWSKIVSVGNIWIDLEKISLD